MKRNVKAANQPKLERKFGFMAGLLTVAVTASIVSGSGINAFGASAGSLAASYVTADYDTSNIVDGSAFSVYLDGEEVIDQFTGDSEIKCTTEGRTLLPIRALGNLLGCTVDWDSDSKVAILTLGSTALEIPIGSEYIVLNNEAEKIDSEGTKAVIYNERTYLPFRSVCENFSYGVSYDSENQINLHHLRWQHCAYYRNTYNNYR